MTENMSMKEPRMTRRRFLDRLWKILGITAVAEFMAVAAVYVWPRRRGEKGRAWVEAGPVAEFTPASVTAFPASRFYLVRLQDGGFLAISSTCSHLDCAIPWNEKDRTFPCPCHASVFSMTGEVLSPPAPRPLDLYSVAIEGGVVRVDIGQRIRRSRFDASQVTYL